MTPAELIRLEAQLAVLKEIQQEYDGHTIGNIIQQMQARVNYYDKKMSNDKRRTTKED